MASGKTLRKLLPFMKPTDADKLCADIEALADAVDSVNEGHQDFLQAGVVEASDWSFTPTINSGTGALGSAAATGGRAWLPDPEISGALMRSVTPSATLSGLTAPTLPTSGKYMTVGIELTATTWGEKATPSVKSGTEYNTQAEAETHAPAISAGKIRIRNVTIEYAAGVYSIVYEVNECPYATGGRVLGETAAEGKIGKEGVTTPMIAGSGVTGPKLGSGTVRQETGTSQSFLSWGLISSSGVVLAGTGDFTVKFTFGSPSTYKVEWAKEKSSSEYLVLTSGTITKESRAEGYFTAEGEAAEWNFAVIAAS